MLVLAGFTDSLREGAALIAGQERWLAAAAMFVLGCLLGSFFNVVGLRLPAGRSPLFPPSACSSCGQRLNAIDLIPVAGWLIRRGKCAHCGDPISPIYMLGEIGTGLSFAAATWFIGDVRELWIVYPLIGVLVILSISDLRYRLLPNNIIFPAMLVCLVLRLWIRELPFWEYAAGFLIGGATLFAVASVSMRMGKPAMGGGDIKLLALLGLAIGVKLVLLALAISSLLGCLCGVALLAAGRIRRRTYIPFGPFIAAGGFVALLFGNQLIAWYWSQFPGLTG